MLLVEAGSRVEGATEDILRCIFTTTLGLLEETMSDVDAADGLALRHLARVHADLASAGYVVRQL